MTQSTVTADQLVASVSSSDPPNNHRVALRGAFSDLPSASANLAKCFAFISNGVPCGSSSLSALSIFVSYDGWMARLPGARGLFDAYVKSGYIVPNDGIKRLLPIESAIINHSFDTLLSLLDHGADERLVPSPAYIATVPTKNEDGSGITLKPIRDVFDFAKIECNEPELVVRMAAVLRANAMRRRIETPVDAPVSLAAAPQRRMRSL